MNGEALVDDAVLVGETRAASPWRRTTGLEGLEGLAHDWNLLAEALRDARFYHRHPWLGSYLRHLERDAGAVNFFAFRRAGRAIAIFPLRHTVRVVAGIPLRVWELPVERHMDLCDALVARSEDSAALLGALVAELARQPEPWDALHLPNLLDGSVALRALQAAPVSFVHLARTATSMHFHCADLETALRDTTPQFIRNLRRQRRKLDGLGTVQAALVREPDALEAALEDFLRIEASGWKGTRGCRSAIALNPHVEAFYREVARRFGADRNCAINLLRLDGKTIAAQYALIDGRRMNLLKIAYDEAYAAEAPGSRLLHDVLAWCCASGEIDELSLVTGPQWAQGRWNPETQDVWSAYVFNASPRGLAACLALRMKPYVAAARERVLSPPPEVRA
ncbi:MAG TPA: GNAT family N-acetyltransferase [Rhodocyclaceae bacterium]